MSDRTLGYRVPEQTAHGIKLKAHLQKIGIMRDSGHEHFTGCVVFPILDDAGEVVEIYGRRTSFRVAGIAQTSVPPRTARRRVERRRRERS